MKKIFIITFTFLISFAAQAQENILFIGNSYTACLRGELSKLFKNESPSTKIKYICPGGATLRRHFDNKKVIETVKTGNWDYIVLQDQSQTPAVLPRNFHTAVDDFYKVFDKLPKKPKVMLYMTWGSRDGDKRNKHLIPTYESMQKKLTENYTKAAKRKDAILVPVGLGFEAIHKKDKELFKKLYQRDGRHQSNHASYMAANLFYCLIKNKTVDQIKYRPKFDKNDASKLKNVAKELLKKK